VDHAITDPCAARREFSLLAAPNGFISFGVLIHPRLGGPTAHPLQLENFYQVCLESGVTDVFAMGSLVAAKPSLPSDLTPTTYLAAVWPAYLGLRTRYLGQADDLRAAFTHAGRTDFIIGPADPIDLLVNNSNLAPPQLMFMRASRRPLSQFVKAFAKHGSRSGLAIVTGDYSNFTSRGEGLSGDDFYFDHDTGIGVQCVSLEFSATMANAWKFANQYGGYIFHLYLNDNGTIDWHDRPVTRKLIYYAFAPGSKR
jgi:hypothetical protein